MDTAGAAQRAHTSVLHPGSHAFSKGPQSGFCVVAECSVIMRSAICGLLPAVPNVLTRVRSSTVRLCSVLAPGCVSAGCWRTAIDGPLSPEKVRALH